MGSKRIKIFELNKHNIAPYKATNIGVYDSDNNCIGSIKIDGIKKDFGNRLYRVGLMSDTHYNDYDDDEITSNYSDDGSQYANDFINALNFYEEKEDVEFCCVAGDISTDNILHVKNFRLQRDVYAPSTPVYSCKGNHDNVASYGYNAEWIRCVSTYDDGKEKRYCPYGNKTSFYFIKTLDNGQKDVYIFLDIDYNNNSSSPTATNTDGAIADEERDHQYYNPETLTWFANLLETHKHDRCFVFTHLFFRQKSGNNHNYSYYRYYSNGRSRKYNLRGQQFIILNNLNNKYKNSIWFTGHSHYCWYWQKYDDIINICNYDSDFLEGSDTNGIGIGNIIMGKYKCDSAYNVHLPSLARPLKLSTEYSVDMKRSEGAIMDVYYDYVDIRGIVFKTSDNDEYINKYCPTSTYRIPIGGNNIKRIDD